MPAIASRTPTGASATLMITRSQGPSRSGGIGPASPARVTRPSRSGDGREAQSPGRGGTSHDGGQPARVRRSGYASGQVGHRCERPRCRSETPARSKLSSRLGPTPSSRSSADW